MKHIIAAASVCGLLLTGCHERRAPATAAEPAVSADPPRDSLHPARNKQLLLDSHGAKLNALFFLASGAGQHPTMLLLHGLPGNERNLDLAQAVRRAGWNVLTFTYRGAWGSEGDFSIANSLEDARAAMAFLRSPEALRTYGIDIDRLVIAGHSMGGFAAAWLATTQEPGTPPLAGVILIDPWDIGADGEALAAAGDEATARAEAALDDLGRSLHGATAASIAAELITRRQDWRLPPLADRLAARPVLLVAATGPGGNAPRLRPFTAALARARGQRARVEEMDTDHGFADHRIALASAVVRWLQETAASPAQR